MNLQPLINRFYMKHFPDMLNVKTEKERDKLLNNYLEDSQIKNSDLEVSALSFFKDVNIPSQVLLSILLGIGKNRFLHLDSTFSDKSFNDIATVYDMVLYSHATKEEVNVDQEMAFNMTHTKDFTFFCMGCIDNLYFPFSLVSLSRRSFFVFKEALMHYASEKMKNDPNYTCSDRKLENNIIVEALDICQKYAEKVADRFDKSPVIIEAYTPFDIIDNTIVQMPAEFNIIFTNIDQTKEFNLSDWYDDLVNARPVSFDFIEDYIDDLIPLMFEEYDELYNSFFKVSNNNIVRIDFGRS